MVDSAPSTDDTEALVARRYAQTGKVRYRREPRPGLGLAHNRGLEEVAGAIVAFTDDDVVVDPGWLEAIAEAFDADDGVGCVTGLICRTNCKPGLNTGRRGTGGLAKALHGGSTIRPRASVWVPVSLCRRHVRFGRQHGLPAGRPAQIGGFDPALGAGTIARGGDDLAAFVSVVRAGHKLVYEPSAIVWHNHRRGEEGMRRQAYGYGVGLGAYLTKIVVDEPGLALHFARKLPEALAHMLGRSSSKNSRLPDDYPASLVWRERLGLLVGVPAYLRSRAAWRRGGGSDAAGHVGKWLRERSEGSA